MVGATGFEPATDYGQASHLGKRCPTLSNWKSLVFRAVLRVFGVLPAFADAPDAQKMHRFAKRYGRIKSPVNEKRPRPTEAERGGDAFEWRPP